MRAAFVVYALTLSDAPPSVFAQSNVSQATDPEFDLPPSPGESGLTTEKFPELSLGSFSCGSTSCHGSPRRESTIGSASHFFYDRDQHQNAGIVLREKRARDIASRLNLPKPAWETHECLACHAPAAIGESDHRKVSSKLVDGVGCESCHGPATHWLRPHLTSEWKLPEVWPSFRREQAGFRETKSLLTRVSLCADCHVGNEKQFVSHDFIAAGHPRLAFEYSAFQAKMPVHWKRSADRWRSPLANAAPSPDRSTYEATNWLVGQLVNADHELGILSRVARESERVWPELAQYDCFACHHELNSPSWRHSRQAWNLKPGDLQWGTWNLGLMSEIRRDLPLVISDQFLTNQDALRSAMQNIAVNRSKVFPLIFEMKQELNNAMRQLSLSPLSADQISAMRDTLLVKNESLTSRGWDQSVQLYLAVVALDKGVSGAVGLGNRVDPTKQEVYVRLRELLSYDTPKQANSPSGNSESPFRLNANWSALHSEFERLRSTDPQSNPGERSGNPAGVLIEPVPEVEQ